MKNNFLRLSVSATKLLINNGFKNVKNIKGGLTQYSKEVDNEFPMY
jgi:predicted sulfurtransferase